MEAGLNNYRTEFRLGTGEFSTVYAVRRIKDSKPYVLKEQRLKDEDERQIQMIKDKIKILDTLKHPNIVSYYGSWEENKCIYILMEYATRGTLRELMNSRFNPLIEQDAFYLFTQIVLGMNYIHSQNILHRDIKPENIMLSGRNGDIVQIGDFGLSKHIHDFTSNAGSFNYVAPEIFQGRPADFSSDIWSMGVVLYEMTNARLPFSAQTYKELSRKVCIEKPEPLNHGSSDQLVSLVSKLLRKNRLRRADMNKLMLCPYLIPYIIKVHLNVGRGLYLLDSNPSKFLTQLAKHLDANLIY